MRNKKFSFKEGAIAFLVAFLISQLLIFAGQLITSGVLALLNYSQSQMNEFFQSAVGNLITQACQFIAFVGVFVYFFKKTSLKSDCKLKKTPAKHYFIFLICGILTMFALSYLVNYFTTLLNLLGYATNTIGYNIKNTGNYFISILSLAILPAIGEELMFRGVMYNAFKKNKIVGILVSSITFALFHFNLSQLIYPFLYGLILSIAYAYTENIIVAITIHFTNNFINITLQHLSNSNSFIASNHNLILATVGVIIFLGILSLLIFMLAKKEKQIALNQTLQPTKANNQDIIHQQNKKEVKPSFRTQINYVTSFMKSEAFISVLLFATMVAFYISVAVLGV